MKSSSSIWHLLHNVKSTGKISLIFVAFLENMKCEFLKFLKQEICYFVWTLVTICKAHFFKAKKPLILYNSHHLTKQT